MFSTISILRPNNYPDKPKPFFTSLTVSDFGIIEVNKVDGSFGEVIVSMASAGIKDGLVIINPSEGEWVDDSQVKTLLQQAGLSIWDFIVNDGILIREKLIEVLNQIKPNADDGFGVSVDQAFTVIGVGLVAIGHVQSGKVNKFRAGFRRRHVKGISLRPIRPISPKDQIDQLDQIRPIGQIN